MRTFIFKTPLQPMADRSTINALTADWISKHGEPRRFPRGFSGDWFNIQSRLSALGYEAKLDKGAYIIRRADATGRPVRMCRNVALARIDAILIENGLEPFMNRKVERSA